MLSNLILIPIIVGISSQVLKLATDSIKGNLNVKTLFITYGGFPSVHTAFIVSAATIAGKIEGTNSPLFALSAVVSVLIIRDAIGLRKMVEDHSTYINRIASKLKGNNLPKLPKSAGHTITEILGGIIYGIAATLLLLKYL